MSSRNRSDRRGFETSNWYGRPERRGGRQGGGRWDRQRYRDPHEVSPFIDSFQQQQQQQQQQQHREHQERRENNSQQTNNSFENPIEIDDNGDSKEQTNAAATENVISTLIASFPSSWKDRVHKFETEYSKDEQLQFLLPENVFVDQLPPRDPYPTTWNDRIAKVTEATNQYITEKLFPSKKSNMVGPPVATKTSTPTTAPPPPAFNNTGNHAYTKAAETKKRSIDQVHWEADDDSCNSSTSSRSGSSSSEEGLYGDKTVKIAKQFTKVKATATTNVEQPRASQDTTSPSLNRDGQQVQDHLHFAEALQYCQPLTLGFQISWLGAGGNDRWSYCPCSKHMKSWQLLCDLKGGVITPTIECNPGGKKAPRELMAHIKALSDRCTYHNVILFFLTELYSDYYKRGYQHIAFADLNSTKYRETVILLGGRLQRMIDKLHLEAEQFRQKEEEFARVVRQKEQLEKTNRILHEELEAKRKFKEQLHVTKEESEVKKVDAAQMIMYKQWSKSIIETMRTTAMITSGIMDCYKNIIPTEVSRKTITIKVPQRFRLQEVFHECYSEKNRDKTCLFKRMVDNNGRSRAGRLVLPLKIEYDVEDILKDKRGRVLSKIKGEFGAVDMGGPRRQFYDQVWTQMADLKVKGIPKRTSKKSNPSIPKNNNAWINESMNESKDGSINEASLGLFAAQPIGFVPQPDSYIKNALKKWINQEDVLDEAKAYYRAIGRIFATCVFQEEPIQDDEQPTQFPMSIAAQALPELYRNVLFRGLLPTDPNYGLNNLVEHAFALLKNDAKETIKDENTIYERLGIMADCDDKAEQLRTQVHRMYIEDRSIALEAMEEGLTLDGTMDVKACFQWMPLDAVNNLVFSMTNVRLEHFLNDDGSHKLLTCQHSGEVVPELLETQELLLKEIANIIRDRGTKKPTFLSEFLSWSTGQSYIPDRTCHDFKVTIEFASDSEADQLPVAITCENVIKLPATAYDGSRETFEMKLDISMELTANSFGMN